MAIILILLIFTFVSINLSQRSGTDNPKMVAFFKQFLTAVTGKTTNERGLAAARKYGKIQEVYPADEPFPCDVNLGRSDEKPNSVHELRPGDIEVIASMGDSLSAGNGLAASRIYHIAIDNRGLSWVIGGRGTWREFLTLPNILKEFNRNLVGFAQEDSSSFMKQAQFSVSEPGAMSRDMPHSAKILVKRIEQDPRVDFKKDWKLVNFLIGGNDFCADVCFLNEKDMQHSPEAHRRDLINAFDYIRDNMPRTLVNFILTPMTGLITELVGRPSACVISHKFECPCLFGRVHQHRRYQMKRIQAEWLKVQEEVGNDPRYRNKEDFTIVVQPFLPNTRIPKLSSGKSDFSYISTDCFHSSQKGGARAANALWNNMLEPVNNKSLEWQALYSTFLCPTVDHPYIYTWANSHR